MSALATLLSQEELDQFTDEELVFLAHDWHTWARKTQLIPTELSTGEFLVWLICTGRGWGKTRTGAETIRQWINDEGIKHINLVARTAADARDTMIEGESGILECCKGDVDNPPHYYPSKRCIVWKNGAKALIFSAEEPDALRGPQCERYWADELASWKYPESTWDMLQFGARLGERVWGIVTTTPRPIPTFKKILKDKYTFLTTGTTYDNADNLSANFTRKIISTYEGTRLGKQEIHGDLLDDNPRALWKRDLIDKTRVSTVPELMLIVTAIDPSTSDSDTSDEAGIITLGVTKDFHFYVLSDASLQASPLGWASVAVAEFSKFNGDWIVGEKNNGGEMVAITIATAVPADIIAPIELVHASRGKRTRAEPISSLYEKELVHHVGQFPYLEDEMCEWVPGDPSPNRMDALVWGITFILNKIGTNVTEDDMVYLDTVDEIGVITTWDKQLTL